MRKKIKCSSLSNHIESCQFNYDGNEGNNETVVAFCGFSDNSFDSNNDACHDCELQHSQPPAKSLNAND